MRTTMTEEHLLDLINTIVKKYSFDRGEVEIDIDFNYKVGSIIIESTYHSYLDVNLNPIVRYVVNHRLEDTPENDKIISGNIKRAIIKSLESFSAVDEFNELYSDDFSDEDDDPLTAEDLDKLALDSGFFSPSYDYLAMKCDEEAFKSKARCMREEVKGIPTLEELK